jgi:N-acetylornithine carbamoyltransferase
MSWQDFLAQIPPIRHYVSGLEGGEAAHRALLGLAHEVKSNAASVFAQRPLAGKVFAAVFLSPSLRTRASFEAAMVRLGGHMTTLTPGAGTWGLEFSDAPDLVMDGANAEHIREAAGVLSSYCDALGMRAFASMTDFDDDMRDQPIQALCAHATVPVISLESGVYHPCQELADAQTLLELFDGHPEGQPFTLTWAPHPKLCGTPVPHSALLAASRLGMDVRLAHPPGYDLHAPVVASARALAEAAGGSLRVTHDQADALKGSRVVYAKAWGSRLDYGAASRAGERNMQHPSWTVRSSHMALTADARFMHCLPVRRGVVVDGAVLDSPASAVQQQAANRMWAQMALLLATLR